MLRNLARVYPLYLLITAHAVVCSWCSGFAVDAGYGCIPCLSPLLRWLTRRCPLSAI